MVLARRAGVATEQRCRFAGRTTTALLLAQEFFPRSADAHERFIKHALKVPLHNEFFRQGPGPMGINPDLVRIATTAYVIMAAFMLLWYVRRPVEQCVEH